VVLMGGDLVEAQGALLARGTGWAQLADAGPGALGLAPSRLVQPDLPEVHPGREVVGTQRNGGEEGWFCALIVAQAAPGVAALVVQAGSGHDGLLKAVGLGDGAAVLAFVDELADA